MVAGSGASGDVLIRRSAGSAGFPVVGLGATAQAAAAATSAHEHTRNNFDCFLSSCAVRSETGRINKSSKSAHVILL
jgi:hypothetical protein